MNIYEIKIIGETFWVCANTIPSALIELSELEGIEISDFTPEDTITELEEKHWAEKKIIYSEPEEHEVSFKEHMEGITKPEVFASTLWLD